MSLAYEQAITDHVIQSRAVGRNMHVRIVLPPTFDAARVTLYPVLYFLHPWGLSPAYITDKLRIHVHLWTGVQEGRLPPMVMVLPTGYRSFFLNAADPPGHDWTALLESNELFFQGALEQYGQYGDYLLDEVIPYVERQFPVRTDRAGRAIGGISMGGAGAAVHAFRDPARFCAVGIHSPALFDGPPDKNGPPWVFGVTRTSFAALNPADVAKNLDPTTQPRVYLDTGSRDMMRDQVEHLHRVLEAHEVVHEYSVPPGGHDKRYWEPRMSEYLAFYARDWKRCAPLMGVFK